MWSAIVVAGVLLAEGGGAAPADDAREAKWRAAFKSANEKITTLQAQIDEDTRLVGDVVVDTTNTRGRARNNEYARAQARLAQNKKKLEQAKTALDDLERKASNESVPREWRR